MQGLARPRSPRARFRQATGRRRADAHRYVEVRDQGRAHRTRGTHHRNNNGKIMRLGAQNTGSVGLVQLTLFI